jgi:hypothetical protein
MQVLSAVATSFLQSANSDITSWSGGSLAGLRNRIINGNFGVNQRGVSGTVVLTAGVYGHDRWKAGAGGCTYTFATALNVTTITISAGTLQQVIEGSNLESGVFRLSFSGTATARVDSGSYGASGASVTGTAVGGTNQTVEFGTGTVGRVQYEFGAVPTAFEQRPIGLELALCQRYYLQLAGNSGFRLDFNGAAANYQGRAIFTFPVPMRAAPTMNAPTSSNVNVNTATYAVDNAFSWNIYGAATAAGNCSIAPTTAITFTAEL